ncbi:MAG: hypothetical protein L0Y43_05470 [Methylococcaceae bacterium]|nr:hypothetical protein [Methylococcaceae bacterium]
MKNVTTELERSETGELTGGVPENPSIGHLPMDVKKYARHVEGFDLTQEQKVELLETLWSILTAFVDLGFGADSVQCLFRDVRPNSLHSGGDPVEDNGPSNDFNQAALKARGKEESP